MILGAWAIVGVVVIMGTVGMIVNGAIARDRWRSR